jgi:serine phosphatase RsbU (regulator of sigma subunit)/CHASE2 domain-containing sensor protein
VTPRAERRATAGWIDRIGLVGIVLSLSFAALTKLQPAWADRLQSAWFDAYQSLAPRQVSVLPVTVVEIDQKSLAAIGQWPWPRTQLARLVNTLQRADAASIGLNVLMPEADALSPERLLSDSTVQDRTVVAALRSLLSYDAVLARALASAPSVLAFVGTADPSRTPLRAAPITVQAKRAPGDDTELAIVHHAGALTSIDELNSQASGWGLISIDPTRGIVRRIPLVANVQGTLVPTLAVEMLRVAYRLPVIRLTAAGSSLTGLIVGPTRVPTEQDGAVRIYYSKHRADRFVSAIDVLEDRVDPRLLRKQLVLIGPTAFGLQELQDTPIGERMSGSEIQAQLLENLLDGTLLHRPRWAPAAEALFVLVGGVLLIWAMRRLHPLSAALLMLVLVALSVLGAFALFRLERVLLDAATPSLYLVLTFGVLLVLSLAESTRQRRSLEGVVQGQRERTARIAGELEAAQRIQTASLPRPDLLRGDDRAELYAALTPAREVGGDLYDYFMLDDDRLFLLIGDVAGKGLSASIFMAVSKALYKGLMIRTPGADIGDIMTAANAEVSRDNVEMLFVTVFAAILDLRSGELAYCNAGHENPYLLRPGSAQPEPIADGDGPPLCAVADFQYRSARRRLAPGEWLCLMTDGVTEAQNRAGALYGHARAERVIDELFRGDASARELVTGLQADVLAFEEGAEANDDLTLIALRWNGAAPDAVRAANAAG